MAERGGNKNVITRTYLLQETENRFTAQCNIDGVYYDNKHT